MKRERERGGGEIRKRERVRGEGHFLSLCERRGRECVKWDPLTFPPLWGPHMFLLCATRIFKGHEKKNTTYPSLRLRKNSYRCIAIKCCTEEE